MFRLSFHNLDHPAAVITAKPRDAAAGASETLVQAIIHTTHVLRRQVDFSPANPVINATLTRFVGAMTAKCDPATLDKVLHDKRVLKRHPDLLRYLSRSECAMENHWAECFLKSPQLGLQDLRRFQYHANYEDLTDLELSHWDKTGDRPGPTDHVVFVGSGALPLTAILLQQKTGARITCVDCDQAAVQRSHKLIARLGMENQMAIVQARGESADYSGITHVIVAALVPDQPGVVRQVLQQAPLARIGVRSAEGLRAMLYPPSDVQKLEQLGAVATGKSATNRTVINTMLTFRCAPRIMQVPD